MSDAHTTHPNIDIFHVIDEPGHREIPILLYPGCTLEDYMESVGPSNMSILQVGARRILEQGLAKHQKYRESRREPQRHNVCKGRMNH